MHKRKKILYFRKECRYDTEEKEVPKLIQEYIQIIDNFMEVKTNV